MPHAPGTSDHLGALVATAPVGACPRGAGPAPRIPSADLRAARDLPRASPPERLQGAPRSLPGHYLRPPDVRGAPRYPTASGRARRSRMGWVLRQIGWTLRRLGAPAGTPTAQGSAAPIGPGPPAPAGCAAPCVGPADAPRRALGPAQRAALRDAPVRSGKRNGARLAAHPGGRDVRLRAATPRWPDDQPRGPRAGGAAAAPPAPDRFPTRRYWVDAFADVLGRRP
jgi:hypothetical protein